MKINKMLLVYSLAVMLLMLTEAEGQHRKPCPCPLLYRPVCGDDGKTYDNYCKMNNCGGSGVVQAHPGPCNK